MTPAVRPLLVLTLLLALAAVAGGVVAGAGCPVPGNAELGRRRCW